MQNVKYCIPDSNGTVEYWGGARRLQSCENKYLLQSQSGAASGREEGEVVILGEVHGQDQPEPLTVLDKEEEHWRLFQQEAPCAHEWWLTARQMQEEPMEEGKEDQAEQETAISLTFAVQS